MGMVLFQKGEYKSHSGQILDFKIDCDSLTEHDLECIAFLVSKKVTFGHIHSIPKGGDRLSRHLRKYIVPGCSTHLIVDDVCTTGSSFQKVFQELRDNGVEDKIFGTCIFNRCAYIPMWIRPIFTLNHW